MKGGRSNRAAQTEAADDWGGDGSWTVDCSCGVTFDDGEEMVNCDECGVWVHTRCSRFVKADKSFACDNCKTKRKRRSTVTVADAEETEVAQLLVDLPTKTLENRKIHLSSDRPLQDRVHVQGVPRDWDWDWDHTALNPDINPFPFIINSRLWNATGYIPKRFNFRYTEFPCWSETLDPPPTLLLSLSNKIKPIKRSRQHSRDRPANKKFKLTAANPLINTVLLPIAETEAHISSGNNVEKSKINASAPEDNAVTTSIDKSANADKKEGLVLAVDESQTAHSESPCLTTDMPKSKPLIEDLTNSASKCTNTDLLGNSEAFIPFGHCSNEPKSDAHIDSPKGVLASQPDANPCEHVSSPDQECNGSKSREGLTNASKPLEQDGKDSDNGSEAVGGCQFDINDEVTKKQKLECESSNSSIEVHKFLRDSKDVSKRAVALMPQPSGAVPPPPLSHHKMVSAGKSLSTTAAIVFARANHNKNRSGGSQNPNFLGKRLMSSSCVNTKKEPAPVDLPKNEDKHDKTMTLKDDQKPFFDSSLKASQPSRTVLKCYASVGKDSVRHSSTKVSSVGSSLVSSSAGEPAEALLSEHALHVQNKNIVSVGQQQTENVPQSNVQPSSKSNQSSSGHPTATSNSPAGLSDEELALLLHQELNSSPRVPRVPRVRHAGSLPQLSSATAANMLMKRTSTSGGKDKNTFSRRKSRDALKEGSRNSREQDNEASKVDRVPSSVDPSKKADTGTLAVANTDSKVKKSREKMSSSAANSSPFSTVELKPSSARVNNPEDEAGANKNSDLTCRTLPGLIAEIMGAGRRMTYEELCNAVLPHWPNLRKHNGERYAYSSHSQAVLDCLRNRTEWARLVDRGPKTSSGRKKRKVDADPLSSESEDGEDKSLKEGESKSFESNKEEYPKGLRKARNRRRLAPQGRSVKDDKKRRKVEVGSSSDSGTSSNSSEDSESSQDDSQGSEMDVANTDVSLSSH